jgi:hypothetical protein
VVLVLGTACGRPPRKPASVPAEAQWIGRGREGRFVAIGAREGAVWNLRVYEASGVQHPATRWRLQGFARTSLEFQEFRGFFDGGLLLTDGTRLVPAP